MQDISNLTLFSVTPSFALAVPVFPQDPKTPSGKTDGKSKGKDKNKSKPKNKPKPLKGLSDYEKAAIERMKRFEPDVATALGRGLPTKRSKKRRIQCVLDELKFVEQRRKSVLDALDSGFADEKKAGDDLDRLKQARKDLKSIQRFYEKDKFPKWFIELRKQLEKAKKEQKDKKPPTSKPTKQKPGANRNGLILLPETFLAGLAAANGGARV